MTIKKLEDELDHATDEFLKSYHSFRVAAVKLMNIMNYMRNNGSNNSVPSLGEGSVLEFLVQVMDESNHMVQQSFEIKCLAEDDGKSP